MRVSSLLTLLFLLAACDPSAVVVCAPQPDRTCEESLEGDTKVSMGQAIGDCFVEFSEDAPLTVDAGGQGGVHSDLVVLIEGEGGADRLVDGLLVDVGLTPDGWESWVTMDRAPTCRDLGLNGYFVPVRFLWLGAGKVPTSLEDDCGLDPCDDPNADKWACNDYGNCAVAWEEYGAASAIRWPDLSGKSARITATVTDGGVELASPSYELELAEGAQAEGG
jgi:hypothetical protein